MNKTIKWILISAGILMVAGALFIALGRLLGGTLASDSIIIFDNAVADISNTNFVSKDFDLNDFTSLDVSTSSIDIEVKAGDVAKLEVCAPSECMPEISSKNGELKIQEPKKGINLHINDGTKSPYYRITVPAKDTVPISIATQSGDVILSDLNLEGSVATTSGDVSLTNIAGDNFEISTSSGDCDLYNCSIDFFNIATFSGDVDIDTVEAKEFKRTSSSGDTKANNCELGSLSMTSSSGEIVLDKIKAETVEIETASGDIELGVDGCMTDYDYMIDTASGDISVGSMETEHKYHTDENKKQKININTASGDIDITF